MNEKEAMEIIKEIKKDNESKIMIINTNTSNIQIRWSNKDLKEMAEISNRCSKENRAIETVLNLLEKKDEIIKNQSYTNKKMRKKLQGYRKLLKLKERQLQKKDKQIEQYQNMLATNDMLHVLECEKKDKMINLMARAFKQDDIRSVEEIIEYFKKKVNSSEQN